MVGFVKRVNKNYQVEIQNFTTRTFKYLIRSDTGLKKNP